MHYKYVWLITKTSADIRDFLKSAEVLHNRIFNYWTIGFLQTGCPTQFFHVLLLPLQTIDFYIDLDPDNTPVVLTPQELICLRLAQNNSLYILLFQEP